MFEIDINLWLVLGAAAAYFMIGALWYSPLLFAKPWMQASGKSDKDMEDGPEISLFAITFVLILILTYVLAHVLQFMGAVTPVEGLIVGAWLWFGIVATTMLINALYAGDPRELTAINAGYHLAGMLAAAAILTTWA